MGNNKIKNPEKDKRYIDNSCFKELFKPKVKLPILDADAWRKIILDDKSRKLADRGKGRKGENAG
jgi:hypothetical protein